jgi:hypothetical protein
MPIQPTQFHPVLGKPKAIAQEQANDGSDTSIISTFKFISPSPFPASISCTHLEWQPQASHQRRYGPVTAQKP